MRGGRKDMLFIFASMSESPRANEEFGKVTESVENPARPDGMVV
jgi:hypothetical protein